MMVLVPAMGELADVDAVRLRLRLEFEENFTLDWTHLLRLRREIFQVGRRLLRAFAGPEREALAELLFPAPVADPKMRHLAPVTPVPLILQLDHAISARFEPGEVLALDFLLVGRSRFLAGVVPVLFTEIGKKGFVNGKGRFLLEGLDSVGVDGSTEPVWRPGEDWQDPAWPLHRLWPDMTGTGPHRLQFVTPARILSGGRPLFRPGLRQLVTAMVRRVSSLVYAWCGVDLLVDPQDFFAALPEKDVRGDLHWQDWRRLKGQCARQDLGGVVGSIDLPDEWMATAGGFIRLCQCFNLGKGAAFGAGSFLVVR